MFAPSSPSELPESHTICFENNVAGVIQFSSRSVAEAIAAITPTCL
jgi:hypothetical protein